LDDSDAGDGNESCENEVFRKGLAAPLANSLTFDGVTRDFADMIGIVSQAKKVYLERSDVLILFAMILLACGMMFSAGVLVGRSSLGASAGGNGEPGHATGVHESEKKVHHATSPSKKNAGSRAPASLKSSASTPGSHLKKAFQDSKQKALNESLLRDGRSAEPKSVRDARAFQAVQNIDSKPLAPVDSVARAPASQPEPMKSQAREATPPAELPKNLKGLFERKPSSVENFEPIPGQFTIQVASYSTMDESQSRVALLRKSGFNDAYFKPIQVGADTWYRVAIGSFSSSDNAQKVADQVVRRRLATSFVVRRVD
jgi:cell division protein FtsN